MRGEDAMTTFLVLCPDATSLIEAAAL